MSDEEDESVKEKTFTFYILLNWKTEDIKLYKTEPKDKKVSPYHVPIEQEITVKIPKKDMVKAKGEVVVSNQKVNEMILEEL